MKTSEKENLVIRRSGLTWLSRIRSKIMGWRIGQWCELNIKVAVLFTTAIFLFPVDSICRQLTFGPTHPKNTNREWAKRQTGEGYILTTFSIPWTANEIGPHLRQRLEPTGDEFEAPRVFAVLDKTLFLIQKKEGDDLTKEELLAVDLESKKIIMARSLSGIHHGIHVLNEHELLLMANPEKKGAIAKKVSVVDLNIIEKIEGEKGTLSMGPTFRVKKELSNIKKSFQVRARPDIGVVKRGKKWRTLDLWSLGLTRVGGGRTTNGRSFILQPLLGDPICSISSNWIEPMFFSRVIGFDKKGNLFFLVNELRFGEKDGTDFSKLNVVIKIGQKCEIAAEIPMRESEFWSVGGGAGNQVFVDWLGNVYQLFPTEDELLLYKWSLAK